MDDTFSTTIFTTTTVFATKTMTRTMVSVSSMSSASSSSTTADSASGIHYSSLYPYNPSLPLAIVFTVFYFLTTLHHGYLSLYLPSNPEIVNKHRYTIPIFVASCLSFLGFLIRSFSIQPQHATNMAMYAISNGLIIISPIFVCATLYLLLCRLISRCLPTPSTTTPTTRHHASATKSASNLQRFLHLPPILLSALFLISDTVSFLLQSLGAVIAASNNYQPPHLTRGTHIVLSGLVLQLATFLIYLATLHLFCRRVRNSLSYGFNPCIMQVVTGTWIASGFILVRTLFRLIEFAMGPDGYTFNHEWCLYVFEAFPVLVSIVVMGSRHPVKWIQERGLAAVRVMRDLTGKIDPSAAATTSHMGVRHQLPHETNGPDATGRAMAGPTHAGNSNDSESGHVRKRSRVGFSWG